MAITRLNPHTIWLGGPRTEVGDLSASEAITPGMLVEQFNNAGIIRFRKSTRTGLQNSSFATEQSMLNLGIDTAYAAGELMEVTVGAPGTTFYGLIASGANIVAGQLLSDAGNGYLKAVSGVAIAEAQENVNNTAGPGTLRIRVQVI